MPIVMQLVVNEVPVVLTEARTWKDRGVDPDAGSQQDPVSTELTPRVVHEAGSTSWLLSGHTLSAHEVPGDTLVTWKLLCEVHPDGALAGFWYEDHMEVPMTLAPVTGRVDGHRVTIEIGGDVQRRVDGLVWPMVPSAK